MSENSIKREGVRVRMKEIKIVAVVNDNTGKHIYVVKDHYKYFPGVFTADKIYKSDDLLTICVVFGDYTHYLSGEHYSVIVKKES